MITNIGLGCQLTKFHEFWWIYILWGVIKIIQNWYLPREGTHINRPNLHVTNTQEASRGHQRTPRGGPPWGAARWGRPDSTLGRPAPGRRPSVSSFESYFNHLQGCILTLREGRFDPRATVPCSRLYKWGPKPPSKGEFIHSIINQKAEDQPATLISLELHQI
jgi:hypothetical protein